MTTSRTAPIPIAHLQAEMVAFPLASEAGLDLCITSLNPRLDEETGDLWRFAERVLVTTSSAVCLDELVAMRDDLWFSDCDPDEVRPLGMYLRLIAQRFLALRGSVAVPLPAEVAARGQLGECSARNDWRWLSLALPPDLLLAGLYGEGIAPSMVDIVSPILARRWMDDGFAEPHVHLNAAFDFGRIWVSTVRGVADSRLAASAFRSPGACFGEGAEMAPWLLCAAVARYVLAAFLSAPRGAGDFAQYLEGDVHARLVEAQGGSGAEHLAAVFDELYRGRPPAPCDYAALRSLYHFLIGGPPRLQSNDPDSVWGWDPIAPLLGGEDAIGGTPEVRFVARALVYMKRQPADRAFAGLFWQVVRIRCLFYRHLVQRPMTPGLQWFVRSFKRLRPARSGLGTGLTAQTAALLCGHAQGLRSLEVRLSPDDAYSNIYAEVRDLIYARDTMALRDATGANAIDAEEALNDADGDCESAALLLGRKNAGSAFRRAEGVGEFEFGITLHLPRDRGGRWSEGRPTAYWAGSHADPAISRTPIGNSTGYRYGGFYRKTKVAAMAAGRLLSECPGSLNLVRGIDLCSDEAGVPTWVMAPLLRYIRDAGGIASAALREASGGAVPPPLRTTVHVGEDFVHLMTGLRRLDEALDYLGLEEGDRLGHALSLGVEPRVWAERAGRVFISREERLFDLLWEWSWSARQGQGTPGGRHAHLQNEIAVQSEHIFGQALTPWELNALVSGLHDETVLRDLGFPDGRAPDDLEEKPKAVAGPGLGPNPQMSSGRRCLQLALRYLTRPDIFARGREIVWFDPVIDVEALDVLQAGLRRKVGRMGLTVEVNPSSNLLIGRFGELDRHPLWRLAAGAPEDGLPPLSVSIGSDDPLTFATTLPEEYQLLYDALVQTGCSDATAHEWLERARKAGMSSRFTLPRGAQSQVGDQLRWVRGGSVMPVLPP